MDSKVGVQEGGVRWEKMERVECRVRKKRRRDCLRVRG